MRENYISLHFLIEVCINGIYWNLLYTDDIWYPIRVI